MNSDEDSIEERRDGAGRRSEDVQRTATLIGLAAVLVSAGIAWGTTQTLLGQKADRGEFLIHVVRESATTNRVIQELERFGRKQDSTNARLQNVICNGKPKYCQ